MPTRQEVTKEASDLVATALVEVDMELWGELKRADIGERADLMAESDVLERVGRRIRAILGV